MGVNICYNIYFFLIWYISIICAQKIQYSEEIDIFLSKWNTNFKNITNLRSSENNEDIESIFGPYNELNTIDYNETEDEINSFAITEDIKLYTLNNNIAEKSNSIYKINTKDTCNDDIVIQQRTYLLSEINFLLPYRSVAFISCKTNRLPDISIRHGVYYTELDSKKYKSYIINSVDMLPGTVFVVNNRTVLIETIESTQQIIASSNIYINIANKKNISFNPIQFSYKSSILQNASQIYSSTLPFSQTFFIQIYSMGSILDTSKVPTETDRNLSASFNDLVYCSEDRKCDGTNFIGKNNTPFSFLREDALENVYDSVFNFITQKIDKFRYRQIVSQLSQYQDGILETGITFNENTVFVTNTKQDFVKKNVQKELVHALGHTYNLSDNSGSSNITSKSLYYYLDHSLNVVLPFDTETRYQYTGAMNGAIGNTDIYPRFNIYSTERIYELMKSSSQIPSDIQDSLVNGGSTLFIVNRYKDFFLFKININTLQEINVSLTKCDGCDTEIEVYETTEKNAPSVFYLNTTEPQRIPDTWLNRSNFIIVKNQYLEKIFYLPNEAENMILPFAGIVPNLYKLIPAYRKGIKQVEPTTNNFWVLNSIPNHFITNQEDDTVIKETVEDYKKYFVNTSYIQLSLINGHWKEIIYLPDILMNDTKIVYIYSRTSYNTIISYQNATNSYNNVTLYSNQINLFFLRYKNGTWGNDSISLNYSDVNTTDIFIKKVKPFNIVNLNVSTDFDNIEIPSSNQFDNLLINIQTFKNIYVNLILDYNKKKILLTAGKNILTYIKNGWAIVNPNSDIHC